MTWGRAEIHYGIHTIHPVGNEQIAGRRVERDVVGTPVEVLARIAIGRHRCSYRGIGRAVIRWPRSKFGGAIVAVSYLICR
jgi:hypothetical protein